MTLPQQVDSRIKSRFDELIARTQRLVDNNTHLMSSSGFETPSYIEFSEIKTNTETLIELLFGHSERRKRLTDDVSRKASTRAGSEGILGILKGLKSDYETGLLQNLSQMIEANIAADYMGQAEQLLGEGVAGQFDHVPAAVLAGAVLEDAFRRLCLRQNPPIPITKPNGDSKTLGTYIDDLKAVGLYNELKAKQLRAWADIRNAAAHGEFAKFNRQDVETMLQGIQNFLAAYL